MQIKLLVMFMSADSNVFEQRPMYPMSLMISVETVDHNAGQNYHNQKPALLVLAPCNNWVVVSLELG